MLNAFFGRTYEKLYENFKLFQRKITEEPGRNFENILGALENLSGSA